MNELERLLKLRHQANIAIALGLIAAALFFGSAAVDYVPIKLALAFIGAGCLIVNLINLLSLRSELRDTRAPMTWSKDDLRYAQALIKKLDDVVRPR